MNSEMTVPYHDGRVLPAFRLRQIDLPEILEWQVNGRYYLVLSVEMTGVDNNKGLNMEDEHKLEATFQVLSVRAVGDKPIDAKALEKADFERTIAKVKSGEA